MFIHYMYVDILFPITKAIPVMSERVTTHYQTLQTWIGHIAVRYHRLYHTCYRTYSLSLACFRAICNGLPCVVNSPRQGKPQSKFTVIHVVMRCIWLIHVCRVWKVAISFINLKFSQISQVFPLAFLVLVK